MEVFQINYVYRQSEERDLEDFLPELQDEVSGEITPYISGRGVFDLVTFLSISVTFVVIPHILTPVVSK